MLCFVPDPNVDIVISLPSILVATMGNVSLILLILIYRVYSQQCSNTHATSTIISISTNKFYVVDQIGIDAFNLIVANATNEFLPSSGNRIGINAFGGETGGDDTNQILPFSATPLDYSDISSTIINLGDNAASYGIDYSKNYGNVVSSAISLAITDLIDTRRQRYHVIFSSGLPLSNGFGDSTNPSNIDDPCSSAISAKQSGIDIKLFLHCP